MIPFNRFFKESRFNNITAIYPGRFQPMFNHHKKVFDQLVNKYGAGNVYIATSDKVESNKSPLNFEQKKKVMVKMLGISPSVILNRSTPYVLTAYNDVVNEDDIFKFALGMKDQAERFPFNNINQNGINMKKDNITPTAIQPSSALDMEAVPYSQGRAYIEIIPNVESDKGVMSATSFRSMIQSASTFDMARQIFFTAYHKPVNKSMDDVILAIRNNSM